MYFLSQKNSEKDLLKAEKCFLSNEEEMNVIVLILR
jgi:aspartate carbamoyltransferase regulatory subunit